jgi:hypothetical protein
MIHSIAIVRRRQARRQRCQQARRSRGAPPPPGCRRATFSGSMSIVWLGGSGAARRGRLYAADMTKEYELIASRGLLTWRAITSGPAVNKYWLAWLRGTP